MKYGTCTHSHTNLNEGKKCPSKNYSSSATTSLSLLNLKVHSQRGTEQTHRKTKSNPMKTNRATEIYFKIVCEMVWQRRHQRKPNRTTFSARILRFFNLFFCWDLFFSRRQRHSSSHLWIRMKCVKRMVGSVPMKNHSTSSRIQLKNITTRSIELSFRWKETVVFTKKMNFKRRELRGESTLWLNSSTLE